MASERPSNSQVAWEAHVKHLIATGRREEAVRVPAPPVQLTRCYIRRNKVCVFGKGAAGEGEGLQQ
jgi:hypothetical protein